jgi:hypothetical protein
MFSKKNLSVAISTIFLSGFVAEAVFAQVQPSNEVQVKSTGESDLISSMDTQGCFPTPPKASCQARIVCTGTADILGNKPRDISEALAIAKDNAEGEVAKAKGQQKKIVEQVKTLQKKYAKEDGAGSTTSSEYGRLLSRISDTSSDQFLQGVLVIGSKVDVKQGQVAVVVGVNCESLNAVQAISTRMQQGQAQQNNSSTGAGGASSSQGGVMGGPQLDSGSRDSFTHKPPNDF